MQDAARKVCLVVVFLVLPVMSAAQGLGSIAGVVRDGSGAVLPGVTVEAASPALIEEVRAVVADRTGRDGVVCWAVGVYTVTFTLPGFNVVKREGIEVAASFTTTANADLAVGAVAETVTVVGESPIVDVRAATQTRALTAANFKEIPSSGSWSNMAGLIPAVSVTGGVDVGGSTGDAQSLALTAHGSGTLDQNQMIDGLKIGTLQVAGARTNMSLSPLLFDEVNVNYAGQGAEATTNGVQLNAIPKAGGNSFQGAFLFSGTNDSLQSDNLTDRLAAMGLTSTNTLKTLYDVNGALGGPIVRDRLWFFGTSRYNTTQTTVAGLFYPVDPASIVRVEDRSQPAYSEQTFKDFTVRLTGALTPQHKVTGFFLYQNKCACFWQISQTVSPEATNVTTWPIYLGQASWTYTATNRLLIEAGWGIGDGSYTIWPRDGEDATYPIPIQEQGGTLSPVISYRAPTNSNRDTVRMHNWRASVTYTTGSHIFKVGADSATGWKMFRTVNFTGYQQYRTRDFVPNQVTIFAPLEGSRSNQDLGLGLCAQDRGTLKRLTLNLGIRLDLNNESVDAFTSQPTFWLPNRNTTYPSVNDIGNWKDWNPRIGTSYDLFGNGRTALKFSASRAVTQDGINTANANSPFATVTTSVARVWTDGNGNFTPDCNLANGANQDNRPAGGDLCGPWLNNTFGSSTPATQYDPDYLRGWHVRPWNWEFSGGVQHEIIPRLSANVSYFRRVVGNFTVTDNVLVGPQDFRPYYMKVPTDPRLPNSGETIELFDVNPALLGATSNFVTPASAVGRQAQHFDGWDLLLDARLRNGLLLQGGVATGKTMTDNCDVARQVPEAQLGLPPVGFPVGAAGNPGAGVWTPLQFCRQSTGYLTQFKLLGSYQLPWWGIRTSATYQSLPGNPITAHVIYTGAQILAANPSLGAFSSGPAGQVTVNVLQPGTEYNERLHQLDWRFTKIVRFGAQTLDLNVDLYNALNADTILTQNNAYGATWMRPTSIIPPRFVKFSARFDF